MRDGMGEGRVKAISQPSQNPCKHWVKSTIEKKSEIVVDGS
jgi:hypothetical protein